MTKHRPNPKDSHSAHLQCAAAVPLERKPPLRVGDGSRRDALRLPQGRQLTPATLCLWKEAIQDGPRLSWKPSIRSFHGTPRIRPSRRRSWSSRSPTPAPPRDAGNCRLAADAANRRERLDGSCHHFHRHDFAGTSEAFLSNSCRAVMGATFPLTDSLNLPRNRSPR